jgi:hypothetical protein
LITRQNQASATAVPREQGRILVLQRPLACHVHHHAHTSREITIMTALWTVLHLGQEQDRSYFRHTLVVGVPVQEQCHHAHQSGESEKHPLPEVTGHTASGQGESFIFQQTADSPTRGLPNPSCDSPGRCHQVSWGRSRKQQEKPPFQGCPCEEFL